MNQEGASRELSEWLGYKVSLLDESLYVRDVFGKVPRSIRYMESLEQIEGVNCPFLGLPNEIAEIGRLRKLDFFMSNLVNLPESIGELRELTSLRATIAGLTDLPKRLVELVSLRELNLSENDIAHLPLGLANMSRLESLILRENTLVNSRSAVDQVAELKSLRELDLAGNGLIEVPERVGKLQLVSLDLSRNYLGDEALSFPDGSFQELRHLSLGFNQLTKLPSFVLDCEALESLRIEHNLITSLPKGIIDRLPALKTVSVDPKLFSSIPRELAEVATSTEW